MTTEVWTNPEWSVDNDAGMPFFTAGAHVKGSGACVMEYVGFLSGEDRWTDQPACTMDTIAKTARRLNDELEDDERQFIIASFVYRLLNARPLGNGYPVRAAIECEIEEAGKINVLKYQRKSLLGGPLVWRRRAIVRDYPILDGRWSVIDEAELRLFLSLEGKLDKHAEMAEQLVMADLNEKVQKSKND